MISEKMARMFELVHEYQICEVAVRRADFVISLANGMATPQEVAEMKEKGFTCRKRCEELQAMMETLSVTASPFIEFIDAETRRLSA